MPKKTYRVSYKSLTWIEKYINMGVFKEVDRYQDFKTFTAARYFKNLYPTRKKLGRIIVLPST